MSDPSRGRTVETIASGLADPRVGEIIVKMPAATVSIWRLHREFTAFSPAVAIQAAALSWSVRMGIYNVWILRPMRPRPLTDLIESKSNLLSGIARCFREMQCLLERREVPLKAQPARVSFERFC
jgi:hypothetical protein